MAMLIATDLKELCLPPRANGADACVATLASMMNLFTPLRCGHREDLLQALLMRFDLLFDANVIHFAWACHQ